MPNTLGDAVFHEAVHTKILIGAAEQVIDGPGRAEARLAAVELMLALMWQRMTAIEAAVMLEQCGDDEEEAPPTRRRRTA